MTRFRYVVVLGALLALAGCGGHGGTGASASSSAGAQDSMLKFAQCMRQHGVQVEDPRPGEPGINIKSKDKVDDGKLNAAMRACRQYSPKKDVDPNDPQVRDRMLKMAQCLRQHGLQVADPQPGQGLTMQVNRSDPKAQQAIQICDRQLGRAGGATPGTRANGG